ncbi:hypothetical protein [Streptomyces sp. NPDC002553]|uniref:hypothetical protein n=1 Tax=Streptomyces sp. NPDC002553 TaxID=3154417 RepID=UPI0033257114
MRTTFPQTLKRLEALIEEKKLDRSRELDPRKLAAQTALPEETVRHLLAGGDPPEDETDDRVCPRIKALADARIRNPRDKGPRDMVELAEDVAGYVKCTPKWARQVIEGKKKPNVDVLYKLSNYFGLHERFFTATADEALNAVLEARVHELDPDVDPYEAVLRDLGVVATDVRSHATMSPEEFRGFLAGVIRLLPQRDGSR